MQSNYHTHTTRCHHADGADEEYVKAAIEQGYTVLGFSDHACWPYKSGFQSHIRMGLEDFADYKKSILDLKEKYQDKITILLGMEAEYFPEYMDWLKEFVQKEGIDYLVFGNHYLCSDEYGPYTGHMPQELEEQYFETCIEGMKTGLYACLAHPELILRNGRGWNEGMDAGFERVCQCAKELDIPLEYNCLGQQINDEYGVEEYPHHKFWEIAARVGCKAIIGMDAHAPADLNRKYYEKARAYLESLGIEITDTIKALK